MSARQLRFFEHSKPLLLRFGTEFFRSVPSTPGIYIMRGLGDRVLYVGQSKNLRTRLHTYKNANPDHMARKILRLVHQVEAIAWEECGSPERARLRENELLRAHRPKFNTVNKYPKAHCFIRAQRVDQCLDRPVLLYREGYRPHTLYDELPGPGALGPVVQQRLPLLETRVSRADTQGPGHRR